jgi:hypothetical protein
MQFEASSILLFFGALVVLGNLSKTSLFSSQSSNAHHEKLKIVIYETGEHSTSLQMFLNATENQGLETIVVGEGSAFLGFGSKYGQLKDTLEELEKDSDSLVAVIDGRDVLLNVGYHVDHHDFQLRVQDFINTFKDLTQDKPDAVMISAEQQCCVAALCHADSPSFFFDPVTGDRTQRACNSGEEGCRWANNDNVKYWQSMMETEAYTRTESHSVSPYLNAGMMVGTPQNLINLIRRVDLGEEEDDQAVLSALYLQFPELIVLDYEQKLLGNNAWPKGLEHGCIYDFDPTTEGDFFLTNIQTGTSPLFLHTPGKFYECLDTLIERLGGVSDKRHEMIGVETSRRHLQYGNYQYGNYQYGYGANFNYNYNQYGDPNNYAEGPFNYGSNAESVEPTSAPVTTFDEVETAQPSGAPSFFLVNEEAPLNDEVETAQPSGEAPLNDAQSTIGMPGTPAPTQAPEARSFWTFLRFWD